MHPEPDAQFLTALDQRNEEGIAHLSLILAHRLRGLVAGIEGFADLLADTLVTREQRELAMKIMEGTARIESVLADLQLYGELQEPTMLPVRIDEILQDVLLPLKSEEQVRIDVRNGGDVEAVFSADPFLLRQALLVLIQNALDATRKSGSITLAAFSSPESVWFVVTNEGVIGSEDAARVFVPFFTTKAHNLGVGLPIARRIARMHGGTLDLTSNSEMEGTSFTLKIPIHDLERSH